MISRKSGQIVSVSSLLGKFAIKKRSVYASAMSTVFDLDFKRIQKDVFWGEDLQNLSDKLFKA